MLSPKMKRTFTVLIFILLLNQFKLEGARILIYPYERGFTSRLMDMKTVAKELLERSYNVTVLINTDDKKYLEDVKGLYFYDYDPPEGNLKSTDSKFMKLLQKNPEDKLGSVDVIDFVIHQDESYCKQLFKNKDMVKKLKHEKFDLFIVDLVTNCGRLLTQYLDLPTIAYNSIAFGAAIETFPNLPSFVGMSTMGFSDEMNFKERFINTLIHIAINIFVSGKWYKHLEDMKPELNLESSPPLSLAYVDKVILAVCDYALDTPRPIIPNVICIAGYNHGPIKPLQDPFDKIVNNAKKGVILLSFGTLLPNMAEEKFTIINEALRNISYDVIWKYKGNISQNISDNIHIVDWMPQYDLLGHPKVKLFITHSGSHSTYETAHHGVPVVSVPISADQPDMAVKLTERAGMGIRIDFNTMTSESLRDAINKVLTNPVYKKNAIRASQLMNDRPITAKETFYFYIDYVIRHKGATHLGMPALKSMNLYEIYNIDVIVLIASIIVVFLGLVFGVTYAIFTFISRFSYSLKYKLKKS